MDSVILSASKKRIGLSLLVKPEDVMRFVLGDTSLSVDEIKSMSGLTPSEVPSEKIGGFVESCGWFGFRTCSTEYFRNKLIPQYKDKLENADFWRGAILGYRHGLILCEKAITDHAVACLNDYSKRISLQLEAARKRQSVDPHSSFNENLSRCYATERNIYDLILECSLRNSANPMGDFLSHLNGLYGVTVGLGDYIISSKSENGFWNNDAGWVSDKRAATPFDSRSDVYATSSDSGIVSYVEPAHVYSCGSDSMIVEYAPSTNFFTEKEAPSVKNAIKMSFR
jgi:hypothetical protein